MNVFKREPAMILAVIQAGIAIAITFGINLTDEQIGTIMGFVSLVIGLITRSQVTPTKGI